MGIVRFFRNIIAVLWLVVAGSIGSLLLMLLPGNRTGMLFIKNVFSPVAFAILRIKVSMTGIDALDTKKSYVFTANHQSHLDTPAIYWKFPEILYFIAKAELKKAPIVGWFISLSGMLFVDRSDPVKARESLTQAADMIKNGKSIISFPEGTRSKDGQVHRFKKGLFELALAAETDVVPIAVAGAHEVWPSGSFKTKAGHIRLHICEPISHRTYVGNAIEFANEAKRRIIDELDRMNTT